MASFLDRIIKLWPRTGPLSTLVGQRFVLGVCTLVLVALAVVMDLPPVGLVVGEPAVRTYRATRDVEFVDQAATAAARRAAQRSVLDIYRYDPSAMTASRSRVAAFFSQVSAALQAHPGDVKSRVSALRSAGAGLDDAVLLDAASLKEDELQPLMQGSSALVESVMQGHIVPGELASVREALQHAADVLPMTLAHRHLVGAVAASAVRPTMLVDAAATADARKVAADSVRPVVVTRRAGDVVIESGRIVTQQQLDMLLRLGALQPQRGAWSLAAAIMLMGLAVLGTAVYLARYEQEVWRRLRKVLVLAILFVGMVWVTRLVVWVAPEISPYLMPVPMAAMLAALLIGPRVGVLTALLVAVTSLTLGFSSGLHIVAVLVASLVSIVAVATISQRRHLFSAAGTVTVSLGVLSGVAEVAAGGSASSAAAALGLGLISGMAAAVLTYGLLPFFEVVFGVTTDVRLLELSNPTHPLLRELMVKAPGTYSHSVMTGNLAEAGAEAIGANPLLARVGAYYHDVGKIRRPQFFVENQGGCENPHDHASPALSAAIITAHVEEGVAAAREHRLPDEVVDIIRQHHGDSLVSYFYDKATGAQGCGCVACESDFRYTGDKPSSKEAALVMLADSAEAAVRCVGQASMDRVECAVRRLVDQKLADGQLVDAGLTLSDIDLVVRTYAKMLVGVYHPRIEYPPREGRGLEDAGTRIEPQGT